jgi:hypothetical protein
MKRISTLTTTTVLLLLSLGLGLPAGEALGQAKVKISKEQLVGAWPRGCSCWLRLGS